MGIVGADHALGQKKKETMPGTISFLSCLRMLRYSSDYNMRIRTSARRKIQSATTPNPTAKPFFARTERTTPTAMKMVRINIKKSNKFMKTTSPLSENKSSSVSLSIRTRKRIPYSLYSLPTGETSRIPICDK